MSIKQLDDYSLHVLEGEEDLWFFGEDMVITYAPLFDDCDGNIDAEAKLKKAGVITEKDEEDSEYCQMFVNFKTKAQGVAFIDRLNSYLRKKAEMLARHASQREWLRAHHGTDEYLDAMRRHAAMRGDQAGVAAAEAFVQHLGHPYPQDDLLAEQFGPATGG